MAKKRHPLEYINEAQRAVENPYARMNERSLLLTNFPKNLIVNDAFVMDLCKEHGDKNVIIDNIFIKDCLMGKHIENRNPVGYVIVEFENTKHVDAVKRGLWKHWIQDKLLKMRTLKDV